MMIDLDWKRNWVIVLRYALAPGMYSIDHVFMYLYIHMFKIVYKWSICGIMHHRVNFHAFL